jgi:5-hydroxyisourate hydrolase
MKSPITSHILNTALGKPAEGIHATLEFFESHTWKKIGEGTTNSDGRINDLLPSAHALLKGTYRINFKIQTQFYPEVPIVFKIDHPNEHYHIPLLISPFGYSTYRGS